MGDGGVGLKKMNSVNKEIVIESKHSLWDWHLGELWDYQDLLFLMVRRDFVSKYKQTLFAPIWMLVQTFLKSVVYVVVFGKIGQISTDGVPPILFYMAGLISFSLFSSAWSSCWASFSSNLGVFSKVYFPRLIAPIASLCSILIEAVLQMVGMGLIYLYIKTTSLSVGLHLHWGVVFLPIIFMNILFLGAGVGLICSSLTIKYRDVRYIIIFVQGMWVYATPVIYPLSCIPEHWRWLAALNPLTSLIEAVKYVVLGVGTVNLSMLGYSMGVTAFVLVLGLVLFHKAERTFVDII